SILVVVAAGLAEGRFTLPASAGSPAAAASTGFPTVGRLAGTIDGAATCWITSSVGDSGDTISLVVVATGACSVMLRSQSSTTNSKPSSICFRVADVRSVAVQPM